MEKINAPYGEWIMPRPRRGGVVFACPLTGHISKNHDKGMCGIKVPVLGIYAAVGEGR
jgi:hypothetical protein